MPKKKLGPVLKPTVKDKSFFVCRHCGVEVVWDESTRWWVAPWDGMVFCSTNSETVHDGKEVTDRDVINEFVGILRELS